MLNGYIKFPKSLEENEKWLACKPAYKRLFNVILTRCTYAKTIQDHFGEDVQLDAFQLFVTIRKLEDWCGNGVSKNDVERGIAHFCKIGFLRQELRHGKTLLTVCNSEFCEVNKKASETKFETNLRQKT